MSSLLAVLETVASGRSPVASLLAPCIAIVVYNFVMGRRRQQSRATPLSLAQNAPPVKALELGLRETSNRTRIVTSLVESTSSSRAIGSVPSLEIDSSLWR